MLAVGWGGVQAGGGAPVWVWWNLIGFGIAILVLLRLTRFNVAVVLLLAAIAGQILGTLTGAVGVVPTWGIAALICLGWARLVRRTQRPNTGRNAS